MINRNFLLSFLIVLPIAANAQGFSSHKYDDAKMDSYGCIWHTFEERAAKCDPRREEIERNQRAWQGKLLEQTLKEWEIK